MSRPLFRASIGELETSFAKRSEDRDFLQQLAAELAHRSTDRAKRLLDRVSRAQAQQGEVGKSRAPEPSPTPIAAFATFENRETPQRNGPIAQDPLRWAQSEDRPRTITNTPEDILCAWTAMEVLSPPAFDKPANLSPTLGDAAVARLDQAVLPWERGERSRPNSRLYYQVVLGTAKMKGTIEALIRKYGDSRPDFPTTKDNSILAIVIVDKSGALVEGDAVAISSFGWGVMAALNGKLSDLASWSDVESRLARKVEQALLGTSDPEQEKARREIPLSKDALTAAFETLLRETGLPREWVDAPWFAIRSYEYFKSPNPPEPLLLNSFFLSDLKLGRELLKSRRAPDNLKRYLGMISPETRRDLLNDRAALEAAIAPSSTPLARWPAPGRYSLALLQQAAVNLAFSETRLGGILGVNGPPGTGKTTLLRDLVAGVVTDRAKAMCEFDDPETAFSHAGQKIKAGNGWLHLYRLDERLRGYEMVVASSNNKAVENVSRELPALTSVAGDAEDLRYFKVLSDELNGRETWGMIAAVLGNASNRGAFKQAFWWKDDVSFNSYLAAALGSKPQISETDETTGKTKQRDPLIVAHENPPGGKDAALLEWRSARKRFLTAFEASQKLQRWLETVRSDVQKRDSLAQNLEKAEQAHLQAKDEEFRSREAHLSAEKGVAATSVELAEWERQLSEHRRRKPGFWARLFRTAKACVWSEKHSSLTAKVKMAREKLTAGKAELARAQGELDAAAQTLHSAEEGVRSARTELEGCDSRLKEASEEHGVLMADDVFFAQEYSIKQKSTPWYSTAMQRTRDELFTAAMHLHRAFLGAAAKPLKHNLGVLMNALSGGSLVGAEKEALLPHLWSSFFLAVPLVSTTFAAVGRMFGRLPAQSLGWLLVDEAGQALPQAAVGAIIRSRRVIVVGDPAQIEPVVVLPEQLTRSIAQSFGVDAETYIAPVASVQTLADAASNFATEFQSRHGSRTVGVPLLVHRRCSEPMFTVSNTIAYSGLMVQAKAEKASRIRDVLGPSRWTDVQGHSEEKWCPEEGAEVVRMLGLLVAEGVPLDLYIVTPFVIVAERLRKFIRESGVLSPIFDPSEAWKWVFERVGTVHTVQGREAEAVILVLGAQKPSQNGARSWAGGRPNLVNVAVTRAKEALYVVGSRMLWEKVGNFSVLCRWVRGKQGEEIAPDHPPPEALPKR